MGHHRRVQHNTKRRLRFSEHSTTTTTLLEPIQKQNRPPQSLQKRKVFYTIALIDICRAANSEEYSTCAHYHKNSVTIATLTNTETSPRHSKSTGHTSNHKQKCPSPHCGTALRIQSSSFWTKGGNRESPPDSMRRKKSKS